MSSEEAVAVIGMALRVPDAADTEEFWANLLASRESIHRLSEEQLLAAGEDPVLLADPHYVPARPLLQDVAGFDHRYFGMSPRECELRNPQHRLFLELCSTALQHAGCEPSAVEAEIGVYGGCAADRYAEDHIRSDPELMAQVGEMVTVVNNNIDYLATYTSYRLGLRGPSLSVRTACSSSLVATHLACQALRLGDCDIALAGGVEIETPYGRGYRHVAGGIESADGHCRPLDAEASGTVFGNGGGVVVLKRLDDALADGDPVYAVLRGSAINNDGPDRPGFTAPSSDGQSRAVAEALAVAGVDPATVGYVELHGTATQIGDPIEVHGLHQAMQAVADRELPAQSCLIGSVKSNLGHLGPASGVVGLIKTVLALHHEQIPPTLHIRTPNPQLKLEQTPFRIADSVMPWPRRAREPRRAGVSSFGFGGTNAHVVVEEAPLPVPAPPRPERDELLVWSAVDEEAEARVRGDLAAVLGELPPEATADVAFTLRQGRRALPVRAALCAATPAEAAKVLADPDAALTAHSDGVRRHPVLTLPGQGSQYPRAAVDLAAQVPEFDQLLRTCLSMFGEELGVDLLRVWQEETDPEVTARTVHAQPLLFSIEYALARTLGGYGLEPSALLGQSVGEVAAATLGGVFELPDAIRFLARRASLMQEMPPGRMLAVAAPEEEVRDLLTSGVAVSAVNSARQVVVGGTAEAVDSFQQLLDHRGLKSRALATSHAFHTPMMAPAVEELTELLAGCSLRAPRIPVISAASGRVLEEAQATDPAFWAGQLVAPVRFHNALDTLAADEPACVLEVGPGHTLTSLARRHAGMRAGRHRMVACLPRSAEQARDDGEWPGFLAALGTAWCDGADLDWGAVPRPEGVRRVALPTYPYQRQEFWLPRTGQPGGARPGSARKAQESARHDQAPAQESAPHDQALGQAPQTQAPTEPTAAQEQPPAHPPEGPVLVLPGWSPAHYVPAARRTTPGERGLAVVLLPDDTAAARAVLTAVQLAGYRTVQVTSGQAYQATDYRATVRADHPEDLVSFLAHLAERSSDTRLLVHARTFGQVPSDGQGPDDSGTAASDRVLLDEGVWSLTELLQAAASAQGADGRPVPVAVVSHAAVSVTGTEPLLPARAALAGLVRSAALEYGHGRVRMIDSWQAAPAVLATELTAPAAEPVVALRRNRRWLPDRVRIEPDGPPGSLLEEQGVYVITGGLGAIGLTVAETLAHSGLRPRLALLGRNADSAWERFGERLAAMEAAGAEVTTHTADVADAAELEQVFALLRRQYGAVHGVLHAAGLPGAGLLRGRARTDMEAVLRAKTTGTRVLQELVARTPGVRFLMLMSSRAALNGLLGSADYAAANAFMDACALTAPPGPAVTVSVNWPAWHEVGMAALAPERSQAVPNEDALDAAAGAATATGAVRWSTTIRPEDWVVDEHRLDGRALLPATAYVDLLVRAVCEAADADPLEPVVIEELTLSKPMFVTAPTEVSVELTPADGGGWDAVVHAAPVSEGTHEGPKEPGRGGAPSVPVTYARARVTAGAEAAPARPHADLAVLGSMGSVIEQRQVQDAATRFAFGPRFGCVRETRREGDTTVGRLELSDAQRADIDVHRVHPALLDRALALRVNGDRVPFHCRRIVVYGELPGALMCRMVLRPERQANSTVDAELYDMLGRAVLTVSDYTKVALREAETFGDNATAAVPVAVDGRVAGDAPAIGLTTGVTPAEGTAALMRLLTAAVPAQVAVVPAQEWTTAPTAGDPTVVGRTATATVPPTTPPSALLTAAGNGDGGTGTGTTPAGDTAPAPAVTTAGDATTEVSRLYAEALGLPSVQASDDFFDIGGDSLTAVQLISRLQDRFGVAMSVADLFDAPAPTALGALISARAGR
ncbi:SDR family oxidoreductase [Streptomyces sp. ISL-10]|uniref:SDR family NAD(P)-dependent oxidoreductase n=1 Tax=Streptomyces sp. ISL-10 TaxID=2819172 RepID=UPI001BE6019D|nr:type I polyketide synthase [Streptomyces sp. ISL-10]MBT2365567.1 SDR family oxidoreductase [Streptomyces sp. ISL-10]